MRKVLLFVALGAALAGCEDLEGEVREAAKKGLQVQAPSTIELRQVERRGTLICGNISHEGSKGRTEFQPFFVQAGELHIITERDYQPGKEGSRWFYEKNCATNQPAQ